MKTKAKQLKLESIAGKRRRFGNSEQVKQGKKGREDNIVGERAEKIGKSS